MSVNAELLTFDEYKIELVNESSFTLNSTDNCFSYDYEYFDEEAKYYNPSAHGIRVKKAEELICSTIICATAGATGIHENSAVIINNGILVCCANKVVCLSLPDLKLIWMKEVDNVCCFQIFKNDEGIFVHGELKVSKIDEHGNIKWSVNFADITVKANDKETFLIHDDFIEVKDWQNNNYKINFDGKFILT